MSKDGDEQVGRVFACLLGLPNDPEALELGRRLQSIKSQDIFTHQRTMCKLIECADTILKGDREQAA